MGPGQNDIGHKPTMILIQTLGPEIGRIVAKANGAIVHRSRRAQIRFTALIRKPHLTTTLHATHWAKLPVRCSIGKQNLKESAKLQG
jgi:hypothetical protein